MLNRNILKYRSSILKVRVVGRYEKSLKCVLMDELSSRMIVYLIAATLKEIVFKYLK